MSRPGPHRSSARFNQGQDTSGVEAGPETLGARLGRGSCLDPCCLPLGPRNPQVALAGLVQAACLDLRGSWLAWVQSGGKYPVIHQMKAAEGKVVSCDDLTSRRALAGPVREESSVREIHR